MRRKTLIALAREAREKWAASFCAETGASIDSAKVVNMETGFHLGFVAGYRAAKRERRK